MKDKNKDIIKTNKDNRDINQAYLNTIEGVLNEYKDYKETDLADVEIKKILDTLFSTIEHGNDKSIKNLIETSTFNSISINNTTSNDYSISDTFELFRMNKLIRNGLITIGGFRSSTKTSFSIQLALDILQRNLDTILIVYSLDDSRAFLKKKMIKQMIDSEDIKRCNTHNNEIYNYIEENEGIKKTIELYSNRIYIFDDIDYKNDSIEIDSISRHIESIKTKYKKDNKTEPRIIVLIDYIQKIKHDKMNVREGLNSICSELKKIQIRYNVMMLALSQLSHDGNYRETSEIENISDVIIKVWGKKKYLEHKNKNTNFDTILNEADKKTFFYFVEKNKAGISGQQYKAFMNENFMLSNFAECSKLDLEYKARGKSYNRESSINPANQTMVETIDTKVVAKESKAGKVYRKSNKPMA